MALLPLLIGTSIGWGWSEVAVLAQAACYGVVFLMAMAKGLSVRQIWLPATTIGVFVGPIVFHLAVFGDPLWLEAAHFTAAVVIAWLARGHLTRAPWRLAFYGMVVLATTTFLVFPDRIGVEFAHRTYWTYPLLALWLGIAASDAVQGRPVSIGPLMGVVWVGLLTSSRSTSLASAAALTALALELAFRRRRSEMWLPMALALGVGILMNLPDRDWLMDAPAVERFADKGVESNRYVLWAQYISGLNSLTILTGREIGVRQELAEAVIGSEENTMHNVLLQLHSVGGIVPVVAAIAGFLMMARAMVGLTGRLVHPVLILIVAKGSFDVIAFPQRFDVIYLLVFFAVWQAWSLQRARASAGPAPVNQERPALSSVSFRPHPAP